MSTPLSLVVALMPLIVAVAGALYQSLIQHIPANQRPVIDNVCRSAVNAVEQQFDGSTGPEKKAQAVAMIGSILTSFHINADPTLINTLVEEAVYYLNQAQQPVDQSQPVGFLPAQQIGA